MRAVCSPRVPTRSRWSPQATALQVKAKHAPDNTPFVTVLVRSCRPNDDHFELGCEFEKTPPWNVLLLFG